MKRVFYLNLLLGSSLFPSAVLAVANPNGSPALPDTNQVATEIIDQASTDTANDLGLLEYFFKRKQTEDGDQATDSEKVRAGQVTIKEDDGPVEELGLLELLLGKTPEPLVMVASIPAADEPLPEPIDDSVPEVGLISYLFKRGPTLNKPATGPGQVASPSPPTHAAARKSKSKTSAKSAAAVESAAMSEDLLRIKVVLGQLPRSALASLRQSNPAATIAPKIETGGPLHENTDPAMEPIRKHDSLDPATLVGVEEKGLLDLLLHRRPDAVGAEAIETPAEDNHTNQTSGSSGAEKGELGILDLLFGENSSRSMENATTSAEPAKSNTAGSSQKEISKIN